MNFINIKSQERKPALILFIMFFSIVAASITGSAIRDSVFLIQFDKSFLPIMYIVIALTMTGIISLYKKFGYNKDLVSVIVFTNTVFLLSIGFFKNNLENWNIPLFYILIEFFTVISLMQFWVLAGEIFNSRQAKRIFSVIIAGGSFASISAGYGIKPFSETYGTSNLLNVTLFFIFITIITTISLKPYRRIIDLDLSEPIKPFSLNRKKIAPYTKNIALLVALSSFISKIIDYQFKITAVSKYTSESDLVNFFGNYYAATGIITLIMQFFITGFVLNRLGILAGLLLLPAAILLGSSGFILIGTLSAIYFVKFSDQVIKFSTNTAIQEILWLPISSKKKKQIKPNIDGSIKSAFEGLAGVLIFVLIYFNIIDQSEIWLLSILTILGSILWVWNSFKLKKGYVNALLESIESRQLNLDTIEIDIKDKDVVKTIDITLNTKNELQQLFVIDLLWKVPLYPWKKTLNSLFKNGSLALKRGVLELVWSQNEIISNKDLLNQIKKKNELTPRLINCASQRKIENLDELLRSFLDSNNSMISTSAAVAILDKNFKDNKAINVLREIIKKNYSNDILNMLFSIKNSPKLISNDDLMNIFSTNNNEIKNLILEIIKKNPDKIFFEIIFQSLLVSSTHDNAKKAIKELPAKYYQNKMMKILKSTQSTYKAKIQILRLADIMDSSTFTEILITFLDNIDLKILNESCNSLIMISKIKNINKTHLFQIENKIDELALRIFQLLHLQEKFRNKNFNKLIIDHIQSDIQLLIVILLKIGTLKIPEVPIEDYIRYIETKDKLFLPIVLELVESTFSNNIKSILLPLIDPDISTDFLNLKSYNKIIFSEQKMLINWVENSHEWKTLIALQNLINREQISILKKINWKNVKLDIFKKVFFNNHQIDYLSRNFFEEKIPIKRSKNMYSILEKTLFLKSVDLFKEIHGEVLSKVAQISEEIHTDLDQKIFDDGDQGDSMYVIINGKVSITKNKKEITLLGPGSCIGEMALLDQEPRSADAICIEDSTLLKINQIGFYELLASNDEIMKQIIKILTKRLRLMNNKFTSNSK